MISKFSLDPDSTVDAGREGSEFAAVGKGFRSESQAAMLISLIAFTIPNDKSKNWQPDFGLQIENGGFWGPFLGGLKF